MGSLLDAKQLNEKIQYELQDFHQMNYDTFIHDFARITVKFCDLHGIVLIHKNIYF